MRCVRSTSYLGYLQQYKRYRPHRTEKLRTGNFKPQDDRQNAGEEECQEGQKDRPKPGGHAKAKRLPAKNPFLQVNHGRGNVASGS